MLTLQSVPAGIAFNFFYLFTQTYLKDYGVLRITYKGPFCCHYARLPCVGIRSVLCFSDSLICPRFSCIALYLRFIIPVI